MTTYDVIMMGGGVMGCATAYHLLKDDPTLKVAIIEKDPTYAKSSTVLSDGNHRLQFNLKENILMSKYGLEMLARFSEEMAVDDEKPNVSFRQEGNLFLTDEAGRDFALAGLELQKSLGAHVEWLTAQEVNSRYPFMNPTTFVGGTFGSDDGTMDPQAVLMGYKNKAVDLGAEYIVGEVATILTDEGCVQGVRLSDGTEHHSRYVVNSSGAWGRELLLTIGIDLPVQPIMRHVFVLETTVEPDEIVPLTVFPSGLYLVHEHGNRFMCGKSLDDDPLGYDFTFRRSIFEEKLWEELVYYIPDFDRMRVVGGWAGLYAVNTLDQNAILGEWPAVKGLMLANGFSGHGFQQCHAVGRHLADLILEQDLYLDLSIFSPQRILDNVPIFENPHKIV